MKETLARLAAWAKKNPLLAFLIVGGVVLLGYLVYRSGGGSSGNKQEEGLAAGDAIDMAGVGSYGGGGGGGGGGPTSPGGGGSTGTGTTGPGGSPPAPQTIKNPRGIKLRPVPPFPLGGIGTRPEINPIEGSLPPIGAFGFNGGMTGPGPTGLLGGIGGPYPTGLIGGVTTMGATASGSSGSSRTTYSSGPGGKRNPKPPVQIENERGRGGGGARTPAMEVGKGRRFTGWYNGIYYNMGVPSGQKLNIPGTTMLGETYIGLTGKRPAAVGRTRY